ncbi:hypothetical protein QH494_09000 [Sphingomonas sp. AR_OL41]|uniref:hypothetical protein n=1 Tax=Sphingomonas sp. AR_OL41 TaxID=3042729 RepID=UPI00247FC067|nr:hypothetical protein [Sphingomonas sp. AR_OL41]MDH7972317.1 hypothetical protein [Sphingomonas sp. AR_OL41]
MKPLTLALLAFAFAPLPLAAQSLHDTHDMRWAPSGKTPSVTWHYRGNDQQRLASNCRAAATPIHLSGKTSMAAAPAKAADCGTQLAQEQPRGAAIAND